MGAMFAKWVEREILCAYLSLRRMEKMRDTAKNVPKTPLNLHKIPARDIPLGRRCPAKIHL